MPKRGDPYRKGNRKIRTLTNNPTRGANAGSKPRKRNAIEGKRSIKRLIKNNPSDGLTQPSANKMTSTKVGGGPGTDKVPSPSIVSKSNKTPSGAAGFKEIKAPRVPLKKR
jgi:hypothetical protein